MELDKTIKKISGNRFEQINTALISARPEMVDFGLEQGLSDFATGGIVNYFEDFKRAKTPLGAKRCPLWMGTH
jgi:hypothetical protein